MLEAIISFFAVGALGFWVLMVVASILFIIGLESEKLVIPVIITVGLGALYFKSLQSLNFDWRVCLGAFLSYLLIGILYSAARWWRYTSKTVKEYNKEDEPTESDHQTLKSKVELSNNKARISGWAAYWPWSVAWLLTGDFWNFLVDGLKAGYETIANHALANAKAPVKRNNSSPYGH